VAAGISRCVAAMLDPNHGVSGGGLVSLRRAGIEVARRGGGRGARLLNEQYLAG